MPSHAQQYSGRMFGVAGRRGFTLTEVLISIALVLVLILGINQVFALTSRAVGSGLVLSSVARTARGVQSVLRSDLAQAEIDRAPFTIIDSIPLVAFRNRRDLAADKDFADGQLEAATLRAIRTVDRGGPAEELTPLAAMTSRTHRADQLIFFTRSAVRSQTGDASAGAPFGTSVSADEAYVSYGHLKQPGPTDLTDAAKSLRSGRNPGVLANWELDPDLEVETAATNPNNYFATDWVLGRKVMLLRDPDANGHVLDAQTGRPVHYYGRQVGRDYSLVELMVPFMPGVTHSTVDGQTMDDGERLDWGYYDTIGYSMNRFRTEIMPPHMPANWPTGLSFRFTGSPAPTRPLSPLGVARTVPCFVPHCTQFAVEYAGDFLKQDADGVVLGAADGHGGGTDGATDVVVDPATGKRTIRWYGFPRDADGDGAIRPDRDVVPLRDVAGRQLPFERIAPPVPPGGNYGAPAAMVPATSRYQCVWGSDVSAYPRPRMIRVTIAIDDPTGRVADEQYFSYVFELP